VRVYKKIGLSDAEIIMMSIAAAVIFFVQFDIFTGDNDSARYLLSAIIQSLASVLAIAFSITLIAVQLTASRYTPQALRLFFNDWRTQFVLALFFSTIILSVYILGNIVNDIPVDKKDINAAVILMAISILSLHPFFLSNLRLLNPEIIIDRLGERVDRNPEWILAIRKKELDTYHNEYDTAKFNMKPDGLYPLKDLVERTIDNENVTTFKYGIRTIEKIWKEIIEYQGALDKIAPISGYFIDSYDVIFERILKKQNIEMLGTIITSMENLGRFYATVSNAKNTENEVSYVANYIGIFGEKLIENDMLDAAKTSIGSLEQLSYYFLEKAQLDLATSSLVRYIRCIGIELFKREPAMISTIISAIKVIGKTAIEQDCSICAFETIDSLDEIGDEIIKKRTSAPPTFTDVTSDQTWILEKGVTNVAESLIIISFHAMSSKKSDEYDRAIKALYKMEEPSKKFGSISILSDGLSKAEKSLKEYVSIDQLKEFKKKILKNGKL
jgi:hypothetical protein